MSLSHESSQRTSIRPGSALRELQTFISSRRQSAPVADLEAFEKELHERVQAVEREFLAEELARLDMDVPAVTIGGILHRRAGRGERTYFSAAGRISVERSIYRASRNASCECPLELRAGIVGGRWTPLACKQALWTVAHLTPQEGEDLFRLLGGMAPSKSSLDRLPKLVSADWEARRREFDQHLREEDAVPAEAASVAVSLDGVMVPMKDVKPGHNRRADSHFQEASCGTLTFYDEDGERLATRRWARMPETDKATLKESLRAELAHVLAEAPHLTVVKIADGALNNWRYLCDEIPVGLEVIDFYHASEHLAAALDCAHGEGSVKARAQFDKLRRILLEEPGGVESVIRSLAHLSTRFPRRIKLRDELRYFRRNRHRMSYALLREANLPIGSGPVEAACKTLVTQRLKRSGMRWRHEGGQAVLTFRALAQSGRYDRGWELVARGYKALVELPSNVVAHPAASPAA